MSLAFSIDMAPTVDQKITRSHPYTSLFKDLLHEAINKKASDIHIISTKQGIDLKYRTHGELKTWKKLNEEHRQGFIMEVKNLTNLSIAKKGKPQDARASFKSLKLDLRASVAPSIYDDDIVLRMIDNQKEINLENLGLDQSTLDVFKEILLLKHGLVLLSGPTGSGKSSTLVGLIKSFDLRKQKVITLENPVEYSIDGTTQIPITKKFSFYDGLKTAMRQDPDIILVGEIRDSETAKLAIEASLTGHLVISTIHANNAVGIIERLLSLEIEKDILKESLRFAGAQRLLKTICPDCMVQIPGVFPPLSHRNSHGCPRCSFLGVVGRFPILEYLFDGEVANFFKKGEGPMKPLKQLALNEAHKLKVCTHEAKAIE